METSEIAIRLVELCRKNEFVQAEKELYASTIVHIETDGTAFKGIDDVLQKEINFLKQLKLLPVTQVSEPLVAGNYFTIRLQMQCDHNERGKIDLDELLVYKVANDKIINLICYSG
ncbi:SnoaL-like domain-containing protein [Mucilaginibacter sp. FT3.2]|uniref:SnoaL-like domain-containing protein n=1 Tax=Mucilaginibacter sp. FT3.2 TaxID=2723090 RepID=UPI00161AA421|nr:SnoaL-like domain-containing protein [Mucilaginibacter sp. FT3.2]MBB6234234.1 hypothetical protein [Mucilaginibacter sp. FT3.2]